MTLTDTLDHLLSVFLRPLRTWIEREFVAPWKAAYDAAMQTKEQYRDGVYLHLRERLEGTDEHPLAEGVPVRPLPAVQDLAHLQSAVELLADRIITGANVPDGTCFAALVFSNAVRNSVTELIDDTSGWIADHIGHDSYGNYFTEFYPNLKKIRLGAKEIKCVYLSTGSLVEEFEVPNAEYISLGATSVHGQHIISNAKVTSLTFPKMTKFTGVHQSSWYWFGYLPNCKYVYFPVLNELTYNGNRGGYSIHYFADCPELREVHFPALKNRLPATNYTSGDTDQNMCARCPNLILLEIGNGYMQTLHLAGWSPTMSLRTDTTASDYIDLREDKDDSGEFINATNLEQFLANFRKYIILRVANRTGQTALTLTLSAAVYQNIYGLDSSNNADNNSWARTHTLADLGLTADDLTEAETAAGITINTIYATWLDTYRSAINWNIGH